MKRLAGTTTMATLILVIATIMAWPAQAEEQEPPAQPTGLTAQATHEDVTLTWDDPQDSSITGYQILRRDKSIHQRGEFITHVDDTGTSALTYTDTDVAEGGRYTYRIKARNPAGLSKRSSYADAKIPDPPPQVAISFQSGSHEVGEGESITIEATLDQDPRRTVSVDLTTTNGGGAGDQDYSGVPESIEFNSGDTSVTFKFSATGDSEKDDGESVTISFTNLPERVSLKSPSETTVSINDNDEIPEVKASFDRETHTITEGSQASISLNIRPDPKRAVTVSLITQDQAGASSQDYSGIPEEVTFNEGQTSASFTFTAFDDSDDEEEESVRVSIGTSLPERVSIGTHGFTTITITDNDETPDADATRDGAIDLGDITGLTRPQYPKHDIDGEDDLVDYFKFTITAPKRVRVGLRQLDHNADISLEDSTGKTLKSSRKDGTSNEAITRTLLEGTYYVRVEAKEPGQNEYALAHGVSQPDPDKVTSLRGTDDPPRLTLVPELAPQNTPRIKLGDVTRYEGPDLRRWGDVTGKASAKNFRASVNWKNKPAVFYRFTITKNQFIALHLTEQDADADLHLTDKDGKTLFSSHNPGTADERILQDLWAGTFQVRVYAQGPGENDFKLQREVMISDPEDVPGMDDIDLSIVDENPDPSPGAANNMGTLTIAKPVTVHEVINGAGDRADWYTFKTNETSTVNIILRSLDAPARLELLDGNHARQATSDNAGKDSESIEMEIPAGTYYVGVMAKEEGWNNYELSVEALPRLISLEQRSDVMGSSDGSANKERELVWEATITVARENTNFHNDSDGATGYTTLGDSNAGSITKDNFTYIWEHPFGERTVDPIWDKKTVQEALYSATDLFTGTGWYSRNRNDYNRPQFTLLLYGSQIHYLSHMELDVIETGESPVTFNMADGMYRGCTPQNWVNPNGKHWPVEYLTPASGSSRYLQLFCWFADDLNSSNWEVGDTVDLKLYKARWYEVPNPPGNVRAMGEELVRLEWDQGYAREPWVPSMAIRNYQIQRSLGGGTWTTISHRDSGFKKDLWWEQNGTSHNYRHWWPEQGVIFHGDTDEPDQNPPGPCQTTQDTICFNNLHTFNFRDDGANQVGSTYRYRIRSRDAKGLVGEWSEPISLTVTRDRGPIRLEPGGEFVGALGAKRDIDYFKMDLFSNQDYRLTVQAWPQADSPANAGGYDSMTLGMRLLDPDGHDMYADMELTKPSPTVRYIDHQPDGIGDSGVHTLKIYAMNFIPRETTEGLKKHDSGAGFYRVTMNAPLGTYSENEGSSDCAAGSTSECSILAGTDATGTLANKDDTDYWHMALHHGRQYSISILAHQPSGISPKLQLYHGSSQEGVDRSPGTTWNYTARGQSDKKYSVRISTDSTETGSVDYTIRVVEISS